MAHVTDTAEPQHSWRPKVLKRCPQAEACPHKHTIFPADVLHMCEALQVPTRTSPPPCLPSAESAREERDGPQKLSRRLILPCLVRTAFICECSQSGEVSATLACRQSPPIMSKFSSTFCLISMFGALCKFELVFRRAFQLAHII